MSRRRPIFRSRAEAGTLDPVNKPAPAAPPRDPETISFQMVGHRRKAVRIAPPNVMMSAPFDASIAAQALKAMEHPKRKRGRPRKNNG